MANQPDFVATNVKDRQLAYMVCNGGCFSGQPGIKKFPLSKNVHPKYHYMKKTFDISLASGQESSPMLLTLANPN